MSLYPNHQHIDLSAPDRCAIRAHNRDASGQSACSDLIQTLAANALDDMSIDDKTERALLSDDWAVRIIQAALRKDTIALIFIINDFNAWLHDQLAAEILNKDGS